MQNAVLNCQSHSCHRREPEKEILYQAIADNLEIFLKRLRAEVRTSFQNISLRKRGPNERPL